MAITITARPRYETASAENTRTVQFIPTSEASRDVIIEAMRTYYSRDYMTITENDKCLFAGFAGEHQA